MLGLLISWSAGVTDWLKCWGYWLAEVLDDWQAGTLCCGKLVIVTVQYFTVCCRAMKDMTRRRWSHIFSSALVLMNWNPPRGREQHPQFHCFLFCWGGGVTTVETDWKQNSCHYSATSRYFGSCMMQLLFRICWVTRYSDCFWTRFKDIKKIQKNAFLLWHRYTICKFSFLFLSSSSKTTNNS